MNKAPFRIFPQINDASQKPKDKAMAVKPNSEIPVHKEKNFYEDA